MFQAHRDGRLDASVIDRFFKRRTVGWRVLIEDYCAGRGLVVGDHDESVPLAFAELLDSVWVADTKLASLEAIDAVGAQEGVDANPVHASVADLRFPSQSFDLVVLQCSANELDQYLAELAHLVALDGRLVVLVDGWTRELGLARMLGMATSQQNGLRARLESAVGAIPFRLSKQLDRNGLAVERPFALLTRGRHENELAFDVRNQDAISWLLDELDVPAGDGFELLRTLARFGKQSGLLAQCYPRYLYVCRRSPRASGVDGDPVDDVIVVGKNRTTVLSLAGGQLNHVRKVPNSDRQARTNENAHRATTVATSHASIAPTIPGSERRQTVFGPARIGKPVTGTPLDRLLDGDVNRFERSVDAAFTWLERLQTETMDGRIERQPAAVAEALTDGRFGLTDPPRIEEPVDLPQVLVHGDFFGSNIYVGSTPGGWQVTGVIDWEWAQVAGNPLVDSGFLTLQLAERLGQNFEDGFERVFLGDTAYAAILYDRLADYCERIGVDPAGFAAYLPIGYVERSRKDVQLNGRLDIDWPSRVRHVWDHHDELERRITGGQVSVPPR